VGSLTGVPPLAGDHLGASSCTWSLGSPASGSALAVQVPCMQLTPGSTLRVTPECVIHSIRMDPRDVGFPLTNNWRVIWDPLLVAQLYYLGFRCPISPCYLVARRYILMIDVWPLLAPWRTFFARFWPTLLVGPAYVTLTLPVVSQRPGTGRNTSPPVSSCNSFSEEAKSLPWVTYVALCDRT